MIILKVILITGRQVAFSCFDLWLQKCIKNVQYLPLLVLEILFSLGRFVIRDIVDCSIQLRKLLGFPRSSKILWHFVLYQNSQPARRFCLRRKILLFSSYIWCFLLTRSVTHEHISAFCAYTRREWCWLPLLAMATMTFWQGKYLLPFSLAPSLAYSLHKAA